MARSAIEELKVSALPRGIRGRPPVDLDSVAQTVSRFGAISRALKDLVAEIDVNPLMAGPDGVTAVDALVVPRSALSGRDPGDSSRAH